MFPRCHTVWRDLLATQPGTDDAVALRDLDAGGPGSFEVYARLRQQLAGRALTSIWVRPGDAHPFAWEHARSNDFFFEDAMRVVDEAVRLLRAGEKGGASGGDAVASRKLATALGMFKWLLDSEFVTRLQACPALPVWLKREQLLDLRREASVAYVRSFADNFYGVRYPMDEKPVMSFPIRVWLAQHGGDADRSLLTYLRGEVLFYRALRTDSGNCMAGALEYMERAARLNAHPRAKERLAYFKFFAGEHFPEARAADASCVGAVEPDEPFQADKLIAKSERVFSWDEHVAAHVFTV